MRKDIRKPRRSVLYVPGSNAKALKKSSTLDVDSLIYDLEDSVALSAKEDARKAIIDILNSGVNKNKEQVIRINNFDSEGYPSSELKRDIENLTELPVIGIIPKLDSLDIETVSNAVQSSINVDDLIQN